MSPKSPQPSSSGDPIFAGGMRARLHFARFRWLRSRLGTLAPGARDVVELGCSDAKTLDFFTYAPARFVGYDANWGGGLDRARERWADHPEYEFRDCTCANDIRPSECFDVAISMETLEHIPPETLDQYLARLHGVTRDYLFVTVPNEKGLIFAAKYLVKVVRGWSPERYTLREFMGATLGRMTWVRRGEHKGFDYAALRRTLGRNFEVLSVESIPFGWLPRWLSFTVGMVARPRRWSARDSEDGRT
jgi:hypothetical protein